jgi:hypothetical protein
VLRSVKNYVRFSYITKTTSMKKGTSQGRVEKQSNPARGARALTPNKQSVSVSNNYADSSDSALNPGTAPQHEARESLTTIFRTLLIKSLSMKPEDTKSVNEK